MHRTKATSGGFGLLQHAAHDFDIDIATAVEHAAYDIGQAFGKCGGQALERFKSTVSGSANPALQRLICLRRIIALESTCIHIAR